MEERLRNQVVDAGHELVAKKLVARTWGNVSVRVDETRFLITPSGLDYNQTDPEDLALYDATKDTYVGHYKPSSEKGIHASAYECFRDGGFVIHTHQTFASAYSVCGFEQLQMTEEERKMLGGIGLADYGLPGTKKLKKNVSSCFEKGAHTVLMRNHGAVVVGKDKEEAFARIELLEEICRRNYKGHELTKSAAKSYSELGIPLLAQLDDMAQMIGRIIPVVDTEEQADWEKYHTVLVKGEGVRFCEKDVEDLEAMKILVEKAAVSALHTRYLGQNTKLGWIDTTLMNYVYRKKYSKKKHAGK